MADERNAQKFNIERIYLKDLSFEIPMGSEVFTREWKPEYQIKLDLVSQPLSDTIWEVVIVATVTAKLDSSAAFVIEAHQASIVSIPGSEGESQRFLLAVDVPVVVFPYLREVVDNVAAKGGFPAVAMRQPDFSAWYEQAGQQPNSPGDGS